MKNNNVGITQDYFILRLTLSFLKEGIEQMQITQTAYEGHSLCHDLIKKKAHKKGMDYEMESVNGPKNCLSL